MRAKNKISGYILRGVAAAIFLWFAVHESKNLVAGPTLSSPASVTLSSTADGFANVNGTTTGGAGGPTVTVSTAADLNFYATQTGPYVIQIQGMINTSSLGNSIHAASNKTFLGVTANAGIIGSLGLYGITNIIVQNLTITNNINAGEGDGITIKNGTTHVWVDHCTFYDCPDGEVDITRQSDFVTVSWCKFYYNVDTGHDFVNLVAADDSDAGNYYLTFHHNWWSTLCHERMPSVRFGHAHVYNNYYNTPGNNYNIRVRIASECLIQNNYFESTKDQYVKYITSPPDGKCSASGNVFVSTTGTHDPCGDTVFTPPYSYSLDAGGDVKSIVMAGAGAGSGGGPPPPPPTAPTSLSTTAVSSSQINLSWTDNASNEDGFSIERSTDNLSFTQVATTGAASGVGSTVNYSNTGLGSSTTYYYRVLAYNLGGNSGYSNTNSAMTQAGSGGGSLPPNCSCTGGVITCTGTLTGSATGRWGMNGTANGANCPALPTPKPCTTSTSANHYDVYPFTNDTGATACFTVAVNTSTCNSGTNLGSAAFLGTYIPGPYASGHNTCTDNTHLNNSGGGIGSGSRTYSFTVANGAPFSVVVANGGTAGCTGGTYTLTVSPCVGSAPTPTPIPTLTTTASGNVTLGGVVSDSATLSGGFNPTGTLTFSLYGPNDNNCTAEAAYAHTASVSGNGNYPSGSFTPAASGTYYWIASYSGDANNSPVATLCNDPNETVVVSPPLALTNSSSRMVHGSAGTFDLDITSGTAIECRSGGASNSYKMVFSFNNSVNNCGTPSVGSVTPGPSPKQCSVDVSVPTGQHITVQLTGVTDTNGSAGNFSATMGVLVGDTTANGVVNSSDIAQVQSQSGLPVDQTNFREDVTANGIINSSDIALVQSQSGTGLQPPVSTTPAPPKAKPRKQPRPRSESRR